MSPTIPPRSAYILSDAHEFGEELSRRLESSGFQIERVDTVEDLSELLMGLSPHVVLVDAGHAHDLAAVGEARRRMLQRSRDKDLRILLVAMAFEDSVRQRLEARRAGAGTVLFPPFSAADVVKEIKTLLAPTAKDGARVLIVEDDRAQALFARSVLNNAGMQAEIEQEPLHVLDALEALHPDLVLMDLHMPDANGVELTALIREHPAFKSTPIVFLSGESDPDARFDAIDAGGDDFLAKPIRPRHLIAAVRNRVLRMRSMEPSARPSVPDPRDEASGLYRREYVLAKIQSALKADRDATNGGVLFLRIVGASALRSRIGLAALEKLASAAGQMLNGALGEGQMAAGIHDNAFLVLAPGLGDDALDVLARTLREVLMGHDFECGGMPLRLRIAVGICPLHADVEDAAALFDAAERTCREARGLEQGVKRYVSASAVERLRESGQVDRLRDAIRNDGLELVYQPIVAVKGSVDAQFQTFVRMRDPDGKLLTGAELLPVAARANLVVELDRAVVARALSVINRQRDNWAPVRLFVPQSMATLAAPDQADWLRQEIGRQGAMGSSLLLECRLEDALLNPPALAALVAALKKVKVRLCLVQFERGEEADALLGASPPGFVKLAPKYVAANAPENVRAELRAIIDHAHRLGVKVIGPNVEDAMAAAGLWMSGIDYLQGNLVQAVGESLDFDFKAGVL